MTAVKAPFSATDLEKWKKILLKRKAEISQDIKDLLHDAIDTDPAKAAPTHQADNGSDLDLQEMSLEQVGNEEQILWQIERALRKIDLSSPLPYGVCEHTQKPIPKSRLTLLPWTPVSIEGAEYMEQNGLSLQDMVLED